MKNILLTVSYDGTNFCGWQRQENTRTVQGEIEIALEKIHKQQTNAQGSGRTDSGVHAIGQTVTFISPIDNMKAENYIPAMNSLLPQDIRIIDAKEVPVNEWRTYLPAASEVSEGTPRRACSPSPW